MEKEKAEIVSLVEKYGRVQSLMKYVNSDTLKESYRNQPKGKAVGTDGITKEEYGESLEENKGMGRCGDLASRHLRTKWYKVSSRRYRKRFMSRNSKSSLLGSGQAEAATMQSRG